MVQDASCSIRSVSQHPHGVAHRGSKGAGHFVPVSVGMYSCPLPCVKKKSHVSDMVLIEALCTTPTGYPEFSSVLRNTHILMRLLLEDSSLADIWRVTSWLATAFLPGTSAEPPFPSTRHQNLTCPRFPHDRFVLAPPGHFSL